MKAEARSVDGRWLRPTSSANANDVSVGAKGGTRTPTVLLPPAPQAGASANSATFAREGRTGTAAGTSRAKPERKVYHSPTRTKGTPGRLSRACRLVVGLRSPDIKTGAADAVDPSCPARTGSAPSRKR
jgi:hypothetical protein